MATSYPRIDNGEEIARPYRLWNPKESELVRWHWYKYAHRAHDRITSIMRWMQPGTVIEIIDYRTGRLIGQYKRTLAGVNWYDCTRENENGV